MFAIISHNAVGTFYNACRGYKTAEEAHADARRWHHTGIGDVVIRESDIEEYRKINNRWDRRAMMMQIPAK